VNVRPLIIRELRAEARRANTYWMRSLAGSFVVALMLYAMSNSGAASSGALLFQAIGDFQKLNSRKKNARKN
jgi:hypothetical protein